MLIEALTPLRVKADGKRFDLEPGQVVDLSPGCAARLLERAPGKVRAIAPLRAPEQTPTTAAAMTITAAAANARVVYWLTNSGIIRCGTTTLLGMEHTRAGPRYWLCIDDEHGRTVWVHESMIRSRRAYEAQEAARRPPAEPYPVGARIIFKVPGLPFEEVGVIGQVTTWGQSPDEPSYVVGTRTIPHRWVLGPAPVPDDGELL